MLRFVCTPNLVVHRSDTPSESGSRMCVPTIICSHSPSPSPRLMTDDPSVSSLGVLLGQYFYILYQIHKAAGDWRCRHCVCHMPSPTFWRSVEIFSISLVLSSFLVPFPFHPDAMFADVATFAWLECMYIHICLFRECYLVGRFTASLHTYENVYAIYMYIFVYVICCAVVYWGI